MSALDTLTALGASKPKPKKKGDKPTFHEPDLADAIQQFIEAKAAEDAAKTIKLQAADQITQRGLTRRLEACAAAGAVVASIGINDRLTFTVQNRYSVVPEEETAALREAFGDDFERYFKPTLAIAMSKGSANNEAVLAEMLEKLGPEFIAQHFEIRRDLLVQDAYHAAYATNPAVQKVAKPFVERQSIKHAAPSLKVQ